MSNTEQIKEAVSNGLKNHKESLEETVDNQYDDGTGKGAMFPDPIADDSTAAANMATIAGFPTAATAGPVKGKKKKNMDYPQWMLNVVRNDLEVSVREAVDAIEMYMLTEAGQMELSAILKKFGIDNKKLKSVGLYFESSGTDIRTIG